MTTATSADDVISILGLIRHPEGGYYREIYRDAAADDSRGLVTSIYYLLRAGDPDRWHRHDAQEIWCHHAGSPVEVSVWVEDRPVQKYRLSSELTAGDRPQVIIPAGAWQSAETLGEYSLVGCVVAPAFQFASFEMTPEGWSPDTGCSKLMSVS